MLSRQSTVVRLATGSIQDTPLRSGFAYILSLRQAMHQGDGQELSSIARSIGVSAMG